MVVCVCLSSTLCICTMFAADEHFCVHISTPLHLTVCQMMYVLCSPTVKAASVMSTVATSDSSPQSLGSGSDRIISIRPDSDHRSVDDMDAGYPSRLV